MNCTVDIILIKLMYKSTRLSQESPCAKLNENDQLWEQAHIAVESI